MVVKPYLYICYSKCFEQTWFFISELPKPKAPTSPTGEENTQSPEKHEQIKPSDSKISSQSSALDAPSNAHPASSKPSGSGAPDNGRPDFRGSGYQEAPVPGGPETFHLTASHPKVSSTQTGHPTSNLTSSPVRFIRDPYKEKT